MLKVETKVLSKMTEKSHKKNDLSICQAGGTKDALRWVIKRKFSGNQAKA